MTIKKVDRGQHNGWIEDAAQALSVMNASVLSPQPPTSDDAWVFAGGGPTGSGVIVTEETALNFASYFACVRLIAEDLGKLSHPTYRRLDGEDRERDRNHRNNILLNVQANDEMPSNIWRETMVANTLVSGNGFSEIERNRRGDPIWLHHIKPWRVNVTRAKSDNRLIYEVANSNGPNVILEKENMLHLKGLGFDGLVGKSVAAMARESVGLGIATDRQASSFFGNGAVYSATLSFPGKITETTAKKIVEEHRREHVGADKSNRLMIVPEGGKLEKWGMSNSDAQMLATRSFQAVEMTRWFRVPPHKIGILENAPLNNIEHQSIEYVVDTLLSWAVRLDMEIAWKLFSDAERSRFFTELNLETLLRGDIKTRFEAWHVALQDGWINRDEVRRRENYNRMPDGQGQVFLFPLNMAPAQQVIDGTAAEPANPGGDNLENTARKMSVRERLQRVGGAHARVLSHQLSQAFNKQKRAYDRAVSKYGTPESSDMGRESMFLWCENFLDSFQDELSQRLLPVFESMFEIFGEVNGGDIDTAGLSKTLVDSYCEDYIVLARKNTCSNKPDLDGTVQFLTKQAINAYIISIGESSDDDSKRLAAG